MNVCVDRMHSRSACPDAAECKQPKQKWKTFYSLPLCRLNKCCQWEEFNDSFQNDLF